MSSSYINIGNLPFNSSSLGFINRQNDPIGFSNYVMDWNKLGYNTSFSSSAVQPSSIFNNTTTKFGGILDWINPISSGINAIGNIGSAFGNYFSQREQLKYQKELQKQLFEREDTAIQRRVADLQKAGLSKTLAVGGAGAGAGAVVNTSAPQMQPFNLPHFEFFQGSKFALEMLKTLQNIQLNQDKVNLAKSQFDFDKEHWLYNKFFGLADTAIKSVPTYVKTFKGKKIK